ncbi:IST1 homolog [Limulus polyphemus]|uniref:IST1 homolog n=1 Tax=Limulus polyphemus TaxID=6850 RepID=A0ABM1BEU8_LIMPO|nr:IST1 homolog [Limulus polyphemus]
MFSAGPNYGKLKTNLRLAINRLKLLEKKKTELAQKARKEIADYISSGKYERAKIRVEHIIREDYLVEAMEVVEMYCDLLLARFGLIQQMKSLDEGLAEAISSMLWATPRLQTDVAELKAISDQLTLKYGKPYAQAACENALNTVNEKLVHKLSVQAPPKILVEKYLIEIAKSHNVPYEPDPDIMKEDEVMAAEASQDTLINFDGNNSGPNYLPGGGMSYPAMQYPSSQPVSQPFQYPPAHVKNPNVAPPLPNMAPSGPYPSTTSAPIGFNLPPNYDFSPAPSYDSIVNSKPEDQIKGVQGHDSNQKEPNGKPKPKPRTMFPTDTLPELPSVPTNSLPNTDSSHNPKAGEESVDFDDLTRRFEELKKRK